MNKYKEYTNFYVIPRGSDGKLINGSYNRVWKVEKYVGAINTTKVQEIGEKMENITLKSKCKRLESLVNKTAFEEGKVLNMDLYNQTTNENISQCLTEPHHNSQRLFDGLRIRKLTPKEAWRLMGFDDSDFEKAAKVNSNAQLYKQAGNSIVVNVLEAILTNLIK
jgi:DNA (cytosine-5)-methyltransferase 1